MPKLANTNTAETRRAIIDDYHANITYTAGWVTGGNPDRELNATTHITQNEGVGFTVEFTGNAIGVYGSLDKGGFVQSSYSLDGGSPSVFNLTTEWSDTFGGADLMYALPFYESPTLEYGSHKLTVTIDRQWTGKAYILDFLTVNVRNDAAADYIIVDDANPAVQYGDSWLTAGSPEFEYNGTTHRASAPGANAQFTFYGISIEVYGTVRSDRNDSTAIAGFRVDDGETGFYNSVNTGGLYFPKLRLYSRGDLSPGQHTLYIDAKTASEFWLDYFIYKPSALPSSSSTSSSPNTSSSSSNKTPAGPIAGGVIGGITGLSLLVFIVIFFYRRRKQSQNPGQLFSEGQSSAFGTYNSENGANSSSSRGLLGLFGSRRDIEHESGQMVDVRASMLPAHRIEPYNIGCSESSIPQVNATVVIHAFSSPYETIPSVQHTATQRMAGPLPQKYRPPQHYPVTTSEYEHPGSSVYTSSDGMGSRSPPPYSNAS
ncbi:hypothetical protein CPB86DRAFT_71573 [Serendipita vermifera]|nr:hypothetical protein CPB86DRAFT_71573 [Serendipita vermifera]